MKKSMMQIIAEVNANCAGDAILTKLGRELYRIGVKPVGKALPKELEPLLDAPLTQLALTNLAVGAGDAYGVSGNESVRAALINGAWENLREKIASTPEGKKALEDTDARYAEIVGSTMTHTPSNPTAPVQNTAKGSSKVLSNVFAGPAGGAIDPRFAAKQNTAEGGENVKEVADDEKPTTYTTPPKTKEELLLDDKNLCICFNPVPGKEAHSRQRDRFRPWESKNFNGYRSDLDGVLFCGGCHNDLSVLYGKEKDALKAQEAEKAKLEAATAKLEALKASLPDLEAKSAKAEATRQTILGLVKEDPTNEDTAAMLATQEKKVADLKAAKEALELEIMEVEDSLDPANSGNKADSTPEANTSKGNATQANAKQSASAADRVKNAGKNKKK